MNTSDDIYGMLIPAIDTIRNGREIDEFLPKHGNILEAPSFAVYLNNGLQACVSALFANYPSVAAVAGESEFRSLARSYALKHPPKDSRLFLYGDAFPSSFDASGTKSEDAVFYHLALVDRMWTEAHVARDYEALDALAFASALREGQSVRLEVAPSTRWHFAEDVPVWQEWSSARKNEATQSQAAATGILLTRPNDAVMSSPLAVSGKSFLDACLAGLGLVEAIDAALSTDETVDVQAMLASFFRAGAFCQQL